MRGTKRKIQRWSIENHKVQERGARLNICQAGEVPLKPRISGGLYGIDRQ